VSQAQVSDHEVFEVLTTRQRWRGRRPPLALEARTSTCSPPLFDFIFKMIVLYFEVLL
jgi:hypothetical protein